MTALLLDLNGVLFEDGTPFPGAVEAVASARRRGHLLRFVTNTATRSQEDLRADLERMGFSVGSGELFTAPLAARSYLQRRGWHPHALVHPAIEDLFADLKLPQGSAEDPDCVVLGDARDRLTYGALNRVFQLVQQGKPLIGIGRNRCFREGGRWMLDAGAFLTAIEWAAGTEALVMGKPSAAFFDELVASTGLPAGDCLMVGDDVEADVAGAMARGLRGVLVRTGKFRPGDEERLPQGGLVIASIAAWPDLDDSVWSSPAPRLPPSAAPE
ncbi:TIGR01458 family HAD-type hydrolase [Synechococcus sp. CCY 9618]|uniref:TIGR01458 family HAD-type hydrolase n=1 Tax=Synechococcus sp. CCY 9618 TaxID=2815602 RepID=UPI001C2348C4|nr:TIGR01458 family HAD-type hydrolase [Synechococcus sp. CCY 9618]